MLSESEREELLERQARVYELADIATKPAQWLIGGVKLLFLAFCVVVALVGTPIYLLCTGVTPTAGQVYAAVLALAGFVLFFLAPYYVVVGGTLFLFGFGTWLWYHPDQTFFQSPANVLLGFELVGYAWVALRVSMTRDFKKQQSGGTE